MANPLESYVEKFILNQEATPHIDELEDDDATIAKVSDKIKGSEGRAGAHFSASKLRIKNAPSLSDYDPRYKTQKVSRASLSSEKKNVSFDPELAKYCLIEDNDDKVVSSDGDDSVEEDEDYSKAIQKSPFQDSDMFEDEVSSDEDDDNNSSHEESELLASTNSESEDNEIEHEEPIKTKALIDSNDAEKSIAVQNQAALYDSLFELRISLQKVLTSSNRLPQHDQYKCFLKGDNGLYKKNIHAAKASTRELLSSLLDLQETLLNRNLDSDCKLNGKTSEHESDEEIPSTDEEKEVNKGEKEIIASSSHKKRKGKIEEVEQLLRKRHKGLHSFRDSTLNKWHEKIKLLSGHQLRDKFNAFDVSPVQHIHNLLADKEKLIKRTQLIGISRGNTFRVLGKEENEQNDLEEYDPEIFDDGDFYSRMLEEVLKKKISSNETTDISRWMEIQNIRKKMKRKVDTKASKGRKIRYEVMSKLEQYLAPCKPPTMDDGAINMLFGSLFGTTSKT